MLLQLTEKFSHPTEYGSRKISATTPPPLNLDPGQFLLLPPPPTESIRAKLGLPPQMDVGPYAYARARHISDTNDEYYTAATASPSADFTLPAECRRRLTRPERQTRTTRSASPISGNTPIPTSNRFSPVGK